MPLAVATDELFRRELKSVPGGYVVIRQMTYGERMKRTSLSGALKVLKNNKSDFAGELAMETDRITQWDFANLVVEHNLEGYNVPGSPDSGIKSLNFKSPLDVAQLSPKVGEEIGTYIDDINNFEMDSDTEN